MISIPWSETFDKLHGMASGRTPPQVKAFYNAPAGLAAAEEERHLHSDQIDISEEEAQPSISDHSYSTREIRGE